MLLNSVAGRAWVRNVQRDPRVTCTVVNLENPYEFVEVRGRAIGPAREGGSFTCIPATPSSRADDYLRSDVLRAATRA